MRPSNLFSAAFLVLEIRALLKTVQPEVGGKADDEAKADGIPFFQRLQQVLESSTSNRGFLDDNKEKGIRGSSEPGSWSQELMSLDEAGETVSAEEAPSESFSEISAEDIERASKAFLSPIRRRRTGESFFTRMWSSMSLLSSSGGGSSRGFMTKRENTNVNGEKGIDSDVPLNPAHGSHANSGWKNLLHHTAQSDDGSLFAEGPGRHAAWLQSGMGRGDGTMNPVHGMKMNSDYDFFNSGSAYPSMRNPGRKSSLLEKGGEPEQLGDSPGESDGSSADERNEDSDAVKRPHLMTSMLEKNSSTSQDSSHVKTPHLTVEQPKGNVSVKIDMRMKSAHDNDKNNIISVGVPMNNHPSANKPVTQASHAQASHAESQQQIESKRNSFLSPQAKLCIGTACTAAAAEVMVKTKAITAARKKKETRKSSYLQIREDTASESPSSVAEKDTTTPQAHHKLFKHHRHHHTKRKEHL